MPTSTLSPVGEGTPPAGSRVTAIATGCGTSGDVSKTLVTLPEETPVNETVETAQAFTDRVGLTLGPLVVNGLYPDRPLDGLTTAEEIRGAAASAGVTVPDGEVEHLAQAARFLTRRRRLQEQQLARLDERLDLPRVTLPFLFSADIGPEELEVLAGALAAGVEALPVGA